MRGWPLTIELDKMSSSALIFLHGICPKTVFRIQAFDEEAQVWHDVDATVLAYSDSPEISVNGQWARPSDHCHLGFEVVRNGVDGIAASVVQQAGDNGDPETMKQVLEVINTSFKCGAGLELDYIWKDLKQQSEGFFYQIEKMSEDLRTATSAIKDDTSDLVIGMNELKQKVAELLSRVDGFDVDERPWSAKNEEDNNSSVEDGAKCQELIDTEKHVRTTLRHRPDGRGMQVVSLERREAIVTPNYARTGDTVNLQEYHTYGINSEPHLAPLGRMISCSIDESFSIDMLDKAGINCQLWDPIEMSSSRKRFGKGIRKLLLKGDHLKEEYCPARHSVFVGDGSRIETIYLVDGVEEGMTLSFEVYSFRDSRRNLALIARAPLLLAHALGYYSFSTKFCCIADESFLFDELPADVYYSPDIVLTCRTMSVFTMLEELEDTLFLEAISPPETFNPPELPLIGYSLDDLLTGLTAMSNATQFSMTTQPGSYMPTTLHRMLRHMNLPNWATLLERLARLFAQAAALNGNPAPSVLAQIREWPEAERNAATLLLLWKSRAVNHGPRISMRAIGVRNGRKLSAKGHPKAVMALGNCDKFGAAFVCPECFCAYATVGERRMCMTMDLICHKCIAVEGNTCAFATLSVAKERSHARSAPLVVHARGRPEIPKDYLRNPRCMPKFPFIRTFDDVIHS
nr:MAG: VP5 [Shelly headland virus]UJQ88355.1 MAG: VP5 [Shelly headland virus]